MAATSARRAGLPVPEGERAVPKLETVHSAPPALDAVPGHVAALSNSEDNGAAAAWALAGLALVCPGAGNAVWEASGIVPLVSMLGSPDHVAAAAAASAIAQLAGGRNTTVQVRLAPSRVFVGSCGHKVGYPCGGRRLRHRAARRRAQHDREGPPGRRGLCRRVFVNTIVPQLPALILFTRDHIQVMQASSSRAGRLLPRSLLPSWPSYNVHEKQSRVGCG